MRDAQQEREQQTVIIVDDDEGNASLLERLLHEEADYQTLAYRSGKEVLERLEDIKRCQPVLFLIDQMLPYMCGLTLYEHLQQVEELKQIPAILITGSTRESVLQEIEKQGLAVIRKPYDIDELLIAIEQKVSLIER